MRCVGRTDDMLIVRGVNVFPLAVRDVVGGFAPRVSGDILVRPESAGVKQEPPLPVAVELAAGVELDNDLAEAIRENPRRLVVSTRVELVPGEPARASTRRNWCTAAHEEDRDPGRPPHHDQRREPPDGDRLLGGRLGMPFVFEQPNLYNAAESHLSFDPATGA